MKGENRSIKWSILSLYAQRNQNRNVIRASFSDASPPVAQLPGTWQSMLPAWIVLPFSIPNMFVQTDKYIFSVCAYIPIRSMCSAFLLDEQVGKIATAASSHLYPVTEFSNCDHWHCNAI